VQHLVGRRLPDVELQATDGSAVNPSRIACACVFFCYPFTGRPNHPNPQGWDDIPGAHGSTPQALAYSDLAGKFAARQVQVFGISFQDAEWQNEFAVRTRLKIPLLSDFAKKFSGALALPTFLAGAEVFLKRITLVARDGAIITVRFPVANPELDARETLGLLGL
jgi:peroxiredoxin